MKKVIAAMLLLLCLTLSGCSGGMEIESGLFVLAMAIDPAPDGMLTVTIKALSGTQDSADSPSAAQETSADAQQQSKQEQTQPGYIVMSATAQGCLPALDLLSATTPRTLNLSTLQEIVLSETLARSNAAMSVLQEIHAMYHAAGDAVVVVTPDNAGDFVRSQRAVLGVRLSKYLKVLFEHFESLDTIPPNPRLSNVLSAMTDGMRDAAAVYAAQNDFSSTLALHQADETDRLPGHLPRTAPSGNEYLGSAVFSGGRMVGTLTGDETGLLCLLMGKANTRTFTFAGAQYKTNLPTRVRRTVDKESGALHIAIRMHLTRVAGSTQENAQSIARRIETDAVALMNRLQAMGSDAVGFGRIAVRRYPTIDAWQKADWRGAYAALPVSVTADVVLR